MVETLGDLPLQVRISERERLSEEGVQGNHSFRQRQDWSRFQLVVIAIQSSCSGHGSVLFLCDVPRAG